MAGRGTSGGRTRGRSSCGVRAAALDLRQDVDRTPGEVVDRDAPPDSHPPVARRRHEDDDVVAGARLARRVERLPLTVFARRAVTLGSCKHEQRPQINSQYGIRLSTII